MRLFPFEEDARKAFDVVADGGIAVIPMHVGYAIVGATAIAAVLTPPDLMSQVLLAVPLIVLYEAAIIGIWFTERSRAREAKRSEAAAEL